MITPRDYFMGREEAHRAEITAEIIVNVQSLLEAVNNILSKIYFNRPFPKVTSGWRPQAINSKVGGATRSLHLVGKAIDLEDNRGFLAYTIIQNFPLLKTFNLWLESPTHTKGWVHLDQGARWDRPIRMFLP
jgi:hypothetical protein